MIVAKAAGSDTPVTRGHAQCVPERCGTEGAIDVRGASRCDRNDGVMTLVMARSKGGGELH